MSDVADCRAMESMYRQRAKADPEHSWKWQGQADRWRELADHENAWRFQKRNTQQRMHAGPMAVQPKQDRGWKQMG
jgi:hypothetical protein